MPTCTLCGGPVGEDYARVCRERDTLLAARKLALDNLTYTDSTAAACRVLEAAMKHAEGE
jgi:hypothetical protein